MTQITSNTIYEYYEIVDDRYFFARMFNGGSVKYLWSISARPVKVKGFEEFDLFIYMEPENKKSWYLVEALTGAVIVRQCDLDCRYMRRGGMRLFVDCLPAELAKIGKGGINQQIVNWLCDTEQQISPRYKAIKV